MINIHEMVEEFHKLIDCPIGTTSEKDFLRLDFRAELIEEELNELDRAVSKANRAEIIDALGDIIYVTVGALVEIGVNSHEVLRRIHESNMTKSPSIENKKAVKGPDFKPVDLSDL